MDTEKKLRWEIVNGAISFDCPRCKQGVALEVAEVKELLLNDDPPLKPESTENQEGDE